MNLEDFDDVEIDSVPQLTRSHPHKTIYNSKIARPGTASLETINRSTTSLLHSHREKPPTSPVRYKSKDNKESMQSPQNKPLPARPSYSPSKRLKQLRDRKEPIDFSKLDNSEDELDESTIIFDVPLSQSLVQLSQNQKLVPRKLMSFASDSTRQSSLMSYDHTTNDASSDFELDLLHEDAIKLTYEFAHSKTVLAAQESAIRCHILSQLEKPQGIEQTGAPTSALKRKLITNTRPTHLPPKDSTESLRHSREVEELKHRAIKEEIRIEKLRLKEIENRQKIRSADLITWEKEIIPDFVNKVKQSSTRELWWRGVPSKLRKWIWVELIEQKSMKPGIVQSLRGRANTLIRTNSPTVQKIRADISRTFPDLGVFQENGAYNEDLIVLLTMYSQHTNSYEYSWCTLAAVLLYNIQTIDETFVSLCGLLNRRLLKQVYSNSTDAFNKESQSFLRTFSKKNNRLFTHFHETLKLEPKTYLIPLLKPVFSNLLSMDVASAIMDVYIFEGDAFLWRCVLGLFDKIGYKLYGDESEILDVIGPEALMKLNGKEVGSWWKYLDVGDEVEFLETVRMVLKKEIKA